MTEWLNVTGYHGLNLRCLDTRGRERRSVLLLHGLLSNAGSWRREIRWLADSMRVLALDQRGHGRSATPTDGDWSREAFVADAAAAIEQAGAAPAVLIGHSMGAINAWCLAASRPDLVSALVVVDACPVAPRTQQEWTLWTRTWPSSFDSSEAVRRFFAAENGDYFAGCVEKFGSRYRLRVPAEQALAIRAEWDERDHWAEFEAVRCPTLIVGGGQSMAPEVGAEMCARQPRAAYVEIPQAGHVVHFDAPDQFRAVVEPFVERIDGL